MTSQRVSQDLGELTEGTVLVPTPNRTGPAHALRWVHGRVHNFLGAIVALAILVILLTATEPTFLTTSNLKNVLVTNSSLFIVAAGMTFVMISSGFDLSIGAMMALAEELLYLLIQAGVPAVASIFIVLGIGFLAGALLNGLLIGVLRINFFVVTLGAMTLIYGIVDVVSNGSSEIINSSTLNTIGNSTVAGIPIPIVITVVVVALSGFILRWTSFGRAIYGVGGNREAARLVGIAVPVIVMVVYGIASLCGALAGVVEASRLASSTPTTGTTIALIAGAAVLLGGTSLFGGVGGMSGTVIGVLVIAVLGNGVNLLGVSNYWQDVVTGAVLLGAILLDRVQKRGQTIPH